MPLLSSSSPSQPHRRQFTPIQEGEVEDEQHHEKHKSTPTSYITTTPTTHHSTPLHTSTVKSSENVADDQKGGGILCNKCLPNSRDKISVVPLDNNSGISPNIFKSLVSTLTRKSPRLSDMSSVTSTPKEEHWKVAIAELSQKLNHATRKRDEAVLEASRLKHTMGELEKKLNKLETYCYNLKSGLEDCTNHNMNSPYNRMLEQSPLFNHVEIPNQAKVIESFLVSVSESRSSVRVLSRALTMQLRQMGGKVIDKMSNLLQPHDMKISVSKNPKSVLLYLEALLNRAFFEDFESIGFQKNAPNQILNPIDRCEANYASFQVLHGLTWEDVLNKGTKHFSEDFSRFCDRKMSEIVAMLGWNRAWPEPLLQAFFGAAKNVWLVHLLATSVHPILPIFRIENSVEFDSVYMEDMGGERAKKLVPTLVRIMVAPGFYIYGNVVKCKVLCRYHNHNNKTTSSTTTLSPP